MRSKWVKSWPKELRLSTAAKMPRSVHKLQLNLDLEPRRRWGSSFPGCFFGQDLNVFRYLFDIFSLCGCCEHIIHHLHLYNMYLEAGCPLFWGETTLQKKAFSHPNRGHVGSILNVFGMFILTWGNDPILMSKFHQLGCSTSKYIGLH